MKYIKFFNTLTMQDVARVGGKNASLGTMLQHLTPIISVPHGFAITVEGFHDTLQSIRGYIDHQLTQIQFANSTSVAQVGAAIRKKILDLSLPEPLVHEITQAYTKLSAEYKKRTLYVAVRSSALSEDLPGASAAGQQDSYLYIRGTQELLHAVKQCMASLFTDRALTYRHEKNIPEAGLSVGVQKMVRADRAVSGVAFSLETDSGHPDFVTINASWGLGLGVVQGTVTPDEYLVHKPLLESSWRPLVKKQCGDKRVAYRYTARTKQVSRYSISKKKRKQFCLSDNQVFDIARAVVAIEKYYNTPMDIEWAVDHDDSQLYIVQARPETVHVRESPDHLSLYIRDKLPGNPLLTGISVGKKIASGIVQVLTDASQIREFRPGSILVTTMTDPDWLPVMRRAAGVITDQGGRTCHAAIVARELGIPTIVGTQTATHLLKNGQEVTLDCSQGTQGFVYEGTVPFTITNIELARNKREIEVMVTIAAASSACQLARLPIDGVGLVRLEFMIAHDIGIHPQAILNPERVHDARFQKLSQRYTQQYGSLPEYYVQKLSQHIGLIAAAFYPRPVIVRLTDFKSNEYKDLLGGACFEPIEENPMLGFRGACRYIDPQYQKAFELECQALVRARDVMGFSNIIIMVPFVRTLQEAEKTVALLAKNGLPRSSTLQIYQMVEVPSNVILLERFAQYFDGFSIGSNDLTQLTLGVDRDSGLLHNLFNEQDPAVKFLIEQAIHKAHAAGKYIGICGQAPSDFPEFAQWLMQEKIDSLSLNPDALLTWLAR